MVEPPIITAPRVVPSTPPSISEELPATPPAVELRFTEAEAIKTTKTVWGEAKGCSEDEWRLVVWCIVNRVDSTHNDFRNVHTIDDAITRAQFHGYVESYPVDERIHEVVLEVLTAWSAGEEPLVLEPYAKTSEYLFFHGDGTHNWFREEW